MALIGVSKNMLTPQLKKVTMYIKISNKILAVYKQLKYGKVILLLTQYANADIIKK